MTILKARYSPEKDEIIGCNPGTFMWHYTTGYKIQFKKHRVKKIYKLSKLVATFNIWFIAIIGFYLFMFKFDEIIATGLLLFLINAPIILFLIYLDINAWIYAIRRYKIRG